MSLRREHSEVVPLKDLLGLAVTQNKVADIRSCLATLRQLVTEERISAAEAAEILQEVLTTAAERGQVDTIHLLVDCGHRLCHSNIIDQNNSHLLLLSAGRSHHIEAVRVLVHYGADVNCADPSGEPLLHKLSRFPAPEVVGLLIDLGARIDQVNSRGETCLFPACQQESSAVTRILLQKKADPNHTSPMKLTPLHVAVQNDSEENAQVLIQHGAVYEKDAYGWSPIIRAAFQQAEGCLDFFLTMSEFSTLEKIDALELAGAFFAPYDTDMTRSYLIRAMMNYRNNDQNLRKPARAPATEMGNMVEAQNGLQLLHYNHNSLQKEALLVAERILGPEHPNVGCLLGQLVDSACDDQEWSHALELLRHGRKPLVWADLSADFDNKLLYILLTMNQQYSFKDCHHALQFRVNEMEQLVRAGAGHAPQFSNHRYHVILGYLALKYPLSDEEKRQLKATTGRLVKVIPAFSQSSVLHHVIQETEWTDAGRSSFVGLVELFIQCGAEVNAGDEKGNTAMHLIVQCPTHCTLEVFSKTARALAVLLLENGAHGDIQNKAGLTPTDLAATGDIIRVLRLRGSLACIAASTIIRKDIPFEMVPPSLKSFVKMHSKK